MTDPAIVYLAHDRARASEIARVEARDARTEILELPDGRWAVRLVGGTDPPSDRPKTRQRSPVVPPSQVSLW